MVRFEGVSKVFPNGYIGLQDVSFVIEPGTLTYLVGESGAGKTTLMRLLIREFIPTEGEIFVDETAISRLPGSKVPHLRRQVSVVFQDYKLLPERTIRENVSLALEIIGTPKSEREKEVAQVLDLVGLGDKAQMFPAQLSGGELQRVAIARALAARPKLLFADEPTGNLDMKTGLAIGELLKTIAGYGTTVIISTHDQNLLKKLPSRELHIHRGRLVKDDGAPTSVEKAVEDSEDELSEVSDAAEEHSAESVQEIEDHHDHEDAEKPKHKRAKKHKEKHPEEV